MLVSAVFWTDSCQRDETVRHPGGRCIHGFSRKPRDGINFPIFAQTISPLGLKASAMARLVPRPISVRMITGAAPNPSPQMSNLLGCQLFRGRGAELANLTPLAAFGGGKGNPRHILLQQVQRNSRKNHVLHEESDVALWFGCDPGRTRAGKVPGIEGVRSRPRRSIQVEGHDSSSPVNPDT